MIRETAVDIPVAPPRRERHDGTTGPKHGEGQDEEHRQAGAVKGAGDQIRVVLEELGAVVAQIKLDEEAADDLAEDDARLRRVVGDVARVLNELREVDLVQAETADLGDELRIQR